MSNPMDKNPEREARVRTRAYQIWEAEGRPHGRDVEFWERARKMEATEGNSKASQQGPGPMSASPEPVVEVEAAAIQANLDETPPPSTGQGRPKAAQPKRRRRS